VIYKRENEETNQNIYFLRKEIRRFINCHVLRNQIQIQLQSFLRYFAKLGRQYIRNMKIQSNKDFNIKILSAEIDHGLFASPDY